MGGPPGLAGVAGYPRPVVELFLLPFFLAPLLQEPAEGGGKEEKSMEKSEGLLVDALGILRDPYLGVVEAALVGGGILRFDCLLRRMSSGDGSSWADLKGPLQTRGPGRRILELNPKEGTLRYSLAPWERGAEMEWGLGWATWSARCSRGIGPWLEWKSSDDILHRATIRADRNDPLTQVAWLDGVQPGEKVRVRHRPLTLEFPARDFTPWVEWTVPSREPR